VEARVGVGAKSKFGGSCYAYRKMIAAKTVFVKFFGRRINLTEAAAPSLPVRTCLLRPLSVMSMWQVLDVLCSLCVGNAVAVRSNQNLIMNNLMPGRDLLLQTNVVDYVYR